MRRRDLRCRREMTLPIWSITAVDENHQTVIFGPGKGPKSLRQLLLRLLLPFSKKALGFLNTHRTVKKLRTHIHDHIRDRSTVLDF